jgi:long-chain acyl-CoA synthetase
MDSGELTPTMKLRRRVVTERYAAEIAAFYHDESTAQR